MGSLQPRGSDSKAACRHKRVRLKSNFFCHLKLFLPVQPFRKKYFASPFGRNSFIDSSRPASSEGRIAIVTNVGRDAVDAGGARDERAHFADGEVVWFL